MAGHQHIPPIEIDTGPKFHFGGVCRFSSGGLGGTLEDFEILIRDSPTMVGPTWTTPDGITSFTMNNPDGYVNASNRNEATDYRLRGAIRGGSANFARAYDYTPLTPITDFSGRNFRFRWAAGYAFAAAVPGDHYLRIQWRTTVSHDIYNRRRNDWGTPPQWYGADEVVGDEALWVSTGAFSSIQSTAPAGTTALRVSLGGPGGTGESPELSYFEIEEL